MASVSLVSRTGIETGRYTEGDKTYPGAQGRMAKHCCSPGLPRGAGEGKEVTVIPLVGLRCPRDEEVVDRVHGCRADGS